MVQLLQRRPGAVFAVLGAYFLAQICIRLSLPHALELDEAQQIFLAQWLAVGYDSQPPFYNWVQWAVTSLLGASLFSLSLVKNGMLFLTYLFYGLAAWLLIERKPLAMLAALGLITIPQVGFEAQRDLTHTVAVIFAAALFLYGVALTLKKPSLAGYALTGLGIGIGFVAKYNFVLLPAAVLVAILWDAGLRKRLLDWRLLVTAAIALAITVPHGLWFLDNLDIATGRTLDKLILETESAYLVRIVQGIGTLLVSVLGFSAVTLIVFAIAFGRQWTLALRASSIWTRLVERVLLVLLAMLVVIIVIGGIDSIRDRYLSPYLLILPLYLCLKLDAARLEIDTGVRKTVGIVVGLMLVIPTILILRIVSPMWTGDYTYLNTPVPAFADMIEAEVGTPSAIVTSMLPLAGNMRTQFPDVSVIMTPYPDFRPAVAPSAERPVVVVWMEWRNSGLPPFPDGLDAFVQQEYGPLRRVDTRSVALPQTFGKPGDDYEFGYAWYVPEAAAPSTP